MPDPVHNPLMVTRAQFDRFTAAGLDTSRMAVYQPLPTGPVEPFEFVPLPPPPPCDCALCRLSGEWGKL